MYFFAFIISSQMYYSCTSTASAVWIYQSSKSHNTWVNLNPLMNAKPRQKEVIYIIMNTNEYALHDYIPCTYKLYWRHKRLRNKVSCVSLNNFFKKLTWIFSYGFIILWISLQWAVNIIFSRKMLFVHITVPGIYYPFMKTFQSSSLYAKDWPVGSAQDVN